MLLACREILLEHPLCFSSIGKIEIHALKVKRKGFFYHLSDSMFVRSAFDGLKELADGVDLQPDEPSKKLSVLDESSLPQIRPTSLQMRKFLVLMNLVLILRRNATCIVGRLNYLGDILNRRKMTTEFDDMQYNGSLEGALKTEPIPKKRQKIKNKHKDALSDHALKEDNAPPFHASGKDTSQQENVILENPVGNAGVKDYGVQKKHDPCEEIQVQGTHVECHDIKLKDTIDVQCNSSLGGIAQPKPAAKKKRKIVKNNESEGPVKENEALLCNFNKETSEAKIGSTENTLENEQKIINSNLEDIDMNEADASNMGRKSDVSELGAAYEVKRTKSSKKHHAVDGRDLSVKSLIASERT
ncbi:hypothetical protein CK203_050653 [Vitis vinifera]|uniref:Uncharacterized protein n=1 Tax=Vitis vinifera TaxID=29760 RepID=A0A438GK96_VITVI|nr:hypothetical protein CK203_050653 [Vitis vinifera]